MAESDRKENPVLREFLCEYIPEITNKNPLFVKVFGPKFAKSQMRKNVLVVYSNESYSVEGYSAYHNGDERSITFCDTGKDKDELLTPDDVEKSSTISETALHESIHAILERSRQKCKEYGILGGTGLLERYLEVEIGRGLNEGFTEWMCEKLGFKPLAYYELTNFVRLIEMAIGTEKTMQLGKGGTQQNFPGILNMTRDDTNGLLSIADDLYITNKSITLGNNIISLLEEKSRIEHCSDDQKTEIQKKYDSNSHIIEKYFQNLLFIEYARNNQLEPNEETLIKFLREQEIPRLKERRSGLIVRFESFVIDRYFQRDLQKILGSSEISDDNIHKLIQMRSILNSMSVDIPDNMKNLKPPMSALVFREEYGKTINSYIKRSASENAEKYKKGELGLDELVQNTDKMFGNVNGLGEEALKQFSKAITSDKDFSSEVMDILMYAYRNSDNEDIIKRLSKASIYKLKSKGTELDISSSVIYDQENMFERYNTQGKMLRSSEEEFEFDFTGKPLDSGKDEYELAINNFLELRKRVFEKNPNAKIHIVSRNIVIQDGDNMEFYFIDDGNLIPMVVEKQMDLQFDNTDRIQVQDETANLPVKLSNWSRIVNFVKRKFNEFRNSGKDGVPNYVDKSTPGQVVFDTSGIKENMDRYRVPGVSGKVQEINSSNRDNRETDDMLR